MKRWFAREDGAALVVALLVSFVVLILSTVVVAQSRSSLEASGQERRRLVAANAAEAGVNDWYSSLQSKTPADIQSSCQSANTSTAKLTGELGSGPMPGSFEATVTFYSDTNFTNQLDCRSLAGSTAGSARIVATGTTGPTQRTMESFIRLKQLTTSGGGEGVVVVEGVSGGELKTQFRLYGSSGNNADLYVNNGNLMFTNVPTLQGSVYVPNGSATVRDGGLIAGDLWAKSGLCMGNNPTINGSVYISNGNITASGCGSNQGRINGNAMASGSIAATLTVGGTKSANAQVPAVPSQEVPTYTYDAGSWTAKGYTIMSYSGANACSDAYKYMQNTWTSGNLVVRLTGTSPCTSTGSNPPTGTGWNQNGQINLKGDLAVITDSGLNFSIAPKWVGQTTTRELFLISGVGTAPSTSCPDQNKDIRLQNASGKFTSVKVLMHTPCKLYINDTATFTGRVMAGSIEMQNGVNLTYEPMTLPGSGTATGYYADIVSIREIT